MRSCWGGTGCCSPQATGDEAGPLLCGALGAILGAAPPDPSNEHKQGGGDPWGGRWPWRRQRELGACRPEGTSQGCAPPHAPHPGSGAIFGNQGQGTPLRGSVKSWK